LLSNAMKYGGPDRWIGLRVAVGRRGRQETVSLTVSDHGRGIGREDLPHLMNVTRSLGSVRHVTGMLLRHARDRLLGHPRGTRMVMGNALVGRLLVTLFGRRVPFWREAAVTGLVTEAGRVTGADVRHAGRVQRILCRGGVVLANGSFSGNPAMRERYFPHVRAGRFHHSHVPASSDGSGIALALACGATVDDSLPQSGAWTPVSMLPSRAGPAAAFSHFGDRAKPGVIVVNRAGRRFANEALNYHDFLQAMFRDCADAPEVEAFVITSHRHLRSYGLGRVPPFPGRIGPFLRSAYLQRGRTITELARNIGVDPPALEETVRRFNEHARRGVDPDFHKGESTWDRACGDPQVSPNPCLAPLDEGPWYAIRMVPGDIGTMTGVRTDPDARVLDAGGSPIPGLYAVGTVASSIMRGTYPAAGVMLGPALTFGYLAACDIAGRRS
ncbi:MAG: FAD-binding protein, partial [Gammaproteobacteria bacterium]